MRQSKNLATNLLWVLVQVCWASLPCAWNKASDQRKESKGGRVGSIRGVGHGPSCEPIDDADQALGNLTSDQWLGHGKRVVARWCRTLVPDIHGSMLSTWNPNRWCPALPALCWLYHMNPVLQALSTTDFLELPTANPTKHEPAGLA
jgi:hypothetical protein